MDASHPDQPRPTKWQAAFLLTGVGVLALFVAGVGMWMILMAAAWVQVAAAIPNAIQNAGDALGAGYCFAWLLQTGEIEAAYNGTTKEFQNRQSFAEFAAVVKAHPELRFPIVEQAIEVNNDEVSGAYRYTVEDRDGRQTTVRLRLKKEGGEWRIDDLIVP
jgi:hypothetical protein